MISDACGDCEHWWEPDSEACRACLPSRWEPLREGRMAWDRTRRPDIGADGRDQYGSRMRQPEMSKSGQGEFEL